MNFLHANGVGTSRAVRIYKTYGADGIEMISEDPTDSPAISWASALIRPMRSRQQ